jgi:hypothetical protein
MTFPPFQILGKGGKTAFPPSLVADKEGKRLSLLPRPRIRREDDVPRFPGGR